MLANLLYCQRNSVAIGNEASPLVIGERNLWPFGALYVDALIVPAA